MRYNKNKTKTKRHGGAATALPLKYFDPMHAGPSAEIGKNLLTASSNIVRPRIGGKRNTRQTRKKISGGFVPSVMEGFVSAASKYIVPLVLFAGYKLISRKSTSKGKRKSKGKGKPTKRRHK